MARRKVPAHRSLLVRMLLASVVIALCAVAVTAWLTVTATTHTLRTERDRSISGDTRIYDTLVGYAATHRDWDGVQGLVNRLAKQTSRTITLTTPSRGRLAGSPGSPGTPHGLPDRPAAAVDPLQVDPALAHRGEGPIDPRAVGPYRLTAKERARLRKQVAKAASCVRRRGLDPQVVELPGGRLDLRFPNPVLEYKYAETCELPDSSDAFPTRRAAMRELTTRTAACLGAEPHSVEVTPDFAVWLLGPRPRTSADPAARVCLEDARRQQLRPYVAPPASLFLGTDAHAGGSSRLTLTGDGVRRVAGAAALVLAVTVGITVVVGLRLIRPLRSLIDATRQPADRNIRIPVRGNDEIGHLTAAFNDLAERRELLEAQRTSMVNDVAHELRSPLTNIRSWLEAAQDGIAPTDRQLLDLLFDEAGALQHIIDDLRDLAAADTGELALHYEMVRVADILDQVVAGQRSRAEHAGVALEIHVDEDKHEVCADPLRLRQVIGNLVGNAVRHTPSGGRISLTCRHLGDEVRIEVRDTGSGIAPEDLPHIFDRFWRAEKSRNRRTGGSGLGLSIARKLTEAHGGTITVRSTLAEGTTFTVVVPRY
ncbi:MULTISPECIES: HAMP domain-containing sensor histidine kinase [Streptomyces]|uniref:sensor histidine kinase n=1 Tax=Streptomyces TaxID=1883 RepID=UPI0029B1BE08|nr:MULTISPECIES: HAMP domain-containing sensor histidine kinase [Streptomyces]MDX3087711.1 HAMP domain-containing sensor histidine kinase [Streptomyces sp. ME12-02E]MDX3331109.1 HAMP domain-containing sensor histidine kinase [Streptomyces sp. ME02-6978a]MDX3361058.1 HAMP domain-containing sensor histidine kinase [Streptomyces sp. ME02-6978.2a]